MSTSQKGYRVVRLSDGAAVGDFIGGDAPTRWVEQANGAYTVHDPIQLLVPFGGSAYKLVPWSVNDPAPAWCARTGSTDTFDGTTWLTTYAYEGTPSQAPPSISRRQFYEALAARSLITQDEAELGACGAAIPQAFLSAMAASPMTDDMKFKARIMLRSSSEIVRADPMTQAFAALMASTLTAAGTSLDDLLRIGAAL